MSRSNVLKIASAVRDGCEMYAIQNNSPRSLAGMCGMASWALKVALFPRKSILQFGEVYKNGHCWIELDNYIIDITATQFSRFEPRIVYDLKSKLTQYRSDYTIRHYRDFDAWWGEYQPTKETTRKILTAAKRSPSWTQ